MVTPPRGICKFIESDRKVLKMKDVTGGIFSPRRDYWRVFVSFFSEANGKRRKRERSFQPAI